ncbi:MAG TPA: right-handed parallel beta-helix repeat-containing protein [Solirubrobacterales bacterium]|nr:right-handed parallel beta-helix repeat-containing protein [Solirubrobacterales bacterium]
MGRSIRRGGGSRGGASLLLFGFVLVILLPGSARAAVLPTSISSNTTLMAAQSPYTGTSVTIKPGVTMTAEPGVIIKITGSFTVEGTLNLLGTASNPVVVTSLKDDVAGGDTNKDGSASSPTPGDWGRIGYLSTAGGTIENAKLRYGGAATDMVNIECPCESQVTIANSSITHSKYAGLSTYRAKLKVFNSNISDNSLAGIRVRGGSPEITGNTISRNGEHGINMSLIQGYIANVDMDGNLIEDNTKNGIRVYAPGAPTRIATASLGDNTLIGNSEKAIEYDAYSNSAEDPSYMASAVPPNIDTNVVEENGQNGIWLTGELKESTSWQGTDYPIVVPKASLAVGPAATLTLEPGVIFKGEGGGGIQVRGDLLTEGSAEDPITFTSIKDDTVGGDANGDGGATEPKPGDWGRISFPSIGGGYLSYMDIRYGGSASDMVNIECPCESQVTIANSSITHSKYAGLRTYRANTKVLHSNISDNSSYGISIRGGSPEITGNTVGQNGEHGINMSVIQGYTVNVDMEGNLVEGNAENGIRIYAPSASTRIVTASLGENTLIGNGEKAIEYDAYSNSAEDPSYVASAVPPNIDTNVVEENGKNGIWLTGELKESTSWQGNDYPLVISGVSFAVGPEATLVLEPGIIFKGDGAGTIQVRGELLTEGNSEDPITFTSLKDDTIGGDTNGDGSASSPAGGDWNGVFYPVADGAEIDYSDIRYAEVAIDVDYLKSMDVSNSDFTSNEKAFDVNSTAVMDEALAALDCLPPYLAFIDSHENFFDSAGQPAPAIDLSSVLSPAIPPEYALLFSFFVSQANATASLYGTDDTIPWAIYSCPPQKIPAVPMSPVLVHSTHSGPNFP